MPIPKQPKPKKLDDQTKKLADYKAQQNDIIELVPMSVKVNLVGASAAAQTTLHYVYLNDTVKTIKDWVAAGQGQEDGIPPIPKTNMELRKTKDQTELKSNTQTLFNAGIKTDGEEVDIEKTKYVVFVFVCLYLCAYIL